MKGNPAGPGGSLTSKPTWSNTFGCPTTSAFFFGFGGAGGEDPRRKLPRTRLIDPCWNRTERPIRTAAGRGVHGWGLHCVSDLRKGSTMSILGIILLVLLVMLVLGALPTWGHSQSWGYGPSGGLGLLLVIVLLLVVFHVF